MSKSTDVADFGSNRLAGALLTAFTYLVGIIFFFPVLWMVLNSFKTEDEANGTPVFFFKPTLDQFRVVTENIPGRASFGEVFTNSFVIVLVSTLIVMILAVPTAFALAIQPVAKWRDILFFFISTKFLPVVAGILPVYIIAKEFDLLNTRWSLIIMYTALNLPLAVWMLRSFFLEVPRELIEAAQIDGASLRSQLISVVMPIVAPGLAATGLLCFIFAWNEFFLSLQLNTSGAQTASVWVTGFESQREDFIAKLSAASTLVVLPVVLAGWVAQKRMIRGLAMGAIK
jgi:sorbitol/mannitol transport system permease protein